MKLDMFKIPIYEGAFLDQFEDGRLIERIVRAAYEGVNPVYVLARPEDKAKAKDVTEMFERIQIESWRRLNQDWRRSEHRDLALLLAIASGTVKKDDEVVGYARFTAKTLSELAQRQKNAIPENVHIKKAMQAKAPTQKQQDYLRRLGFEGEIPNNAFTVSRLIDELKRTKEVYSAKD